MDIKILIALLPVIFMFHDFEEIIMFNPWLTKNRAELKRRFPEFEKFIAKRNFFQFSTSAYAIAVMFEFLLISAITFLSLFYNNYQWWFAAFMAFFIHLFVHTGQWIIYRKYVPVIITTFLSLPYCIYTVKVFIKQTDMNTGQLFFWSCTGLILTAVSFIPAFYLASRFETWKNKYTR